MAQIRRKGMILIISGPSGSGKGTLIKKLMACDPSICFSCSVTTRAPRPGEVEGTHYYFVDDAEYHRLQQQGAFLESANVHGHNYGTLWSEVQERLDKGLNVLLDIDPQGAGKVMQTVTEYVSIFILPPSLETLRVRLHTRNTEDEAEIERRLNNARGEIKTVSLYQYALINDDLELAFVQLQTIVNAEKHRTIRFFPSIPEE